LHPPLAATLNRKRLTHDFRFFRVGSQHRTSRGTYSQAHYSQCSYQECAAHQNADAKDEFGVVAEGEASAEEEEQAEDSCDDR
jgi:hypothetical protein